VLKIAAWMERRHVQPGKDAYDLWLILRYYLDAGNRERLYTEAAHLLERGDFDYEAAGAWLLGHDMARLLAADAKTRVAAVLERESNPNGSLALVGDMRTDPQAVLILLSAMTRGFLES
jgi:predicted nucleotidyltransferase